MSAMVFESTRGSGLGTKAGRWALLALWALHVSHEILAGTPFSYPWVWLSYGAGLLGAVLVTAPGTERLSHRRALGLVACSLAAGTALLTQGVISDDVIIYIYAAFLLALAVTRDNPVAGGLGAVLLVVFGLAYAAAQGAPRAAYFELLTMPVLVMFGGYLMRWWFRWMVVREQSFRTETERSLLEATAAEVSTAASRRALLAVSEEAGPLLRALSDGAPITPSLQTELSTAEAHIRDGLVAPGMAHPLLSQAIRRQRERGARVVLLGHLDADGESSTLADALAERLAADISEFSGAARVTIRQHPPASQTACTLVIQGPNDRLLRRYSMAGTIVSAA